MSLPDPTDLLPVLTHLSTFGECYLAELVRSARPWLGLLAEAGWIEEASPEVYVVTPAYLALSDELAIEGRLRSICLSVPRYRRYLLAILAEGLVAAGQIDEYQEQLEQWIVGDLAPLAPEINTILDELENGRGRIIEWPKQQIEDRFRLWHNQHPSFAPWDTVLLGRSGVPEELFTAVLSRVSAFQRPCASSAEEISPLTFLPLFDLPKDQSGRLALPYPAPWSRARRFVHSSVPLFAFDNRPLYDQLQPVQTMWQDALAQQPYYRAMLRTAIEARLSQYSVSKVVALVTDDLATAHVQSEGKPGKSFVELLPSLVEAMGFQAATAIGSEHVQRILEHWMAVGALEKRDGVLLLHESYAQTLHERRRRKALLCGAGEQEQEQVKAILKEGV